MWFSIPYTKMRFQSIIPPESQKHRPFSGLNGSSLNDLGKESLFKNINLPLEQEQIQHYCTQCEWVSAVETECSASVAIRYVLKINMSYTFYKAKQ